MEETRNAENFDGEDRISRLPDAIIHHILSFIDMKYAVQTGVLSKRWIHIWKSLPFLNFNRWSFSRENTKLFVDFVYMVFIFRDDTNIQNFKVEWVNSAFDSTVITNVNRWSLNAVKYHVQEIIIVITECHDSAYEIPHHLFNCKSLRMLAMLVSGKARYVDIILPRSMNLPQLKALTLFGISIANVESSQRLFSSCPVLEKLRLSDCNIRTDDLRNLIVDSLSLKRFEYSDSVHRNLLPQNDATANIIKLCALNLKVFTCESLLALDLNYSLENCSSLFRVSFEMFLNDEDENEEAYEKLPLEKKDLYVKRMIKFLGVVYMVKELSLSSGFVEVLSQAPDLLDCQPPHLCNLKCLVLEMWSTRGCLRAIVYLLKISPHITQLFLESKKSNVAYVGDDWEAGLSSPEMLSLLEYVQFEEMEGCDVELKLLSFLLKNAKKLEKVALFFCSSVGSPDRVKYVQQFQDKLKAVPKASSSIQLVFDEPDLL